MICRHCGALVTFVRNAAPDVWARPHYTACHAPVNLHDRGEFPAGARIEAPSRRTQYRLRARLEADCRAGVYDE